MKKIITFLLLVLMLPTLVLAKPEYKSLTLEEALKDEKIEYDLGGYEETDEKATIYLFRGKGCSHCYEFLEYVSSDLIKKYGNYFKIITYEVWNNADNAKLMQEVSDYLDDDASGVPYIVIGDKTFNGYAESMNEEIESAIKELYDSEERYDVLTQIETNPKETKKKSDNTFTIVSIIFAATAIFILIITSIKKQK